MHNREDVCGAVGKTQVRGPPGRSGAKLSAPAQLAQLVEHFHGKEGVAGSSPALGFRFCAWVGLARVRNGYVLAAAGLPDRPFRGNVRLLCELVEDVSVGVEGHRWRVARLAADFDDAAALRSDTNECRRSYGRVFVTPQATAAGM
jgi:hypothetical protein